MLPLIGLALIVLGGAAMVGRVAQERERIAAAWVVVDLVLAVAAFYLVWQWQIGRAIVGADVGVGAMALPLFAPIAVHVGVGVVVARLPVPAGQAGRGPWPMVDQLVEGREVSAQCSLRFTDAGIAVDSSSDAPAFAAPFDAFTEVRRDGECLRLRWRDADGEHSALLQPAGRQTREGRERFADQFADRFRRLAAASRTTPNKRAL